MRYEGKKTKNISFPLGGIGTGCIGLFGNGELRDFEIFNRPAKNTGAGYTFFSVKASREGYSDVRVLHGDTNESYMGEHSAEGWRGFGFGPSFEAMGGFPHFRKTVFDAVFPIANITFSDEDFPAELTLTAFNPLIPSDEFNSSIPAAFFEWEIRNTSECDLDFDLIFTLENPALKSKNESFREGGVSGIFFSDADKSPSEIGYSDLTVLTDSRDTTLQDYWYRGAWRDAVTSFWREISESDGLSSRVYNEPGRRDRGSVSARVHVGAKDSGRVRFVLSWSCPLQYNYWNPIKDEDGRDVTWRNYYATVFPSSKDSAKYSISKFTELYNKTKKYRDAIENSSLPDFVRDAISSNVSVLKSATVMRLEDGRFWAWEGVQENVGSCDGSCQHVWNYAYAMPYLFPRLERSLRETTMDYELSPSGATSFRVQLPLGRECERFRPCLDGQMGEVIKCYREWKLSGDTEWLKRYSEKIFSMLEYAWSEDNPDRWDHDRDGILEGRQHHTLDMELFGPSSWLQGMYLLALDCASEMADALGEADRAREYRRVYESGKRWTNENLFKNGYFIHKTDINDKTVIDKFEAQEYWNEERGEIKYQIADGCFIDQVLSDFHAALVGREGVFDKEKKLSALESLYKYNHLDSMRKITNMWRNFALNDESATVMCTYPEGAYKPIIPIPYCEEAMTGFEYALGALFIKEGLVDKGETIVRSVRDRYDGEKRNPWCEIECGCNYARSMASFALLPIYSGFTCDMTRGYIGFSPIDKTGVFPFFASDTWGVVTLADSEIKLDVLGDPISLSSFAFPSSDSVISVSKDGTPIDFNCESGALSFPPCEIKESLIVRF